MRKTYYFTGASALFLTIADLAAKYISIHKLSEREEIIVIPHTLSFLLYKNTGALANIPLPMVVIIPLSVAILVFCFIYLVQLLIRKSDEQASALLIVILGAIGNLTDRLWNGFTTDYILLFSKSAVNIADGLILGGLLWFMIASRRRTPQKPSELGGQDINI